MEKTALKNYIISEPIESILKSNKIKILYLFGSFIKRGSNYNDIDIGVLFEKGFSPVECFELAADLYLKLSRLVEEKIDIAVLNNADPAFKYEVLSNGEILYMENNDTSLDIEFKTQTLREYFDYHHKLKIYKEELIKRIKEGVYI